MKLKEFYDNAIAIGRENDPRGKEIVAKDLLVRKRAFDSFKEDEREFFDQEVFSNSYSDSRILNGSG